MFLHVTRVVPGISKKASPPTIATAQTTAINRRFPKPFLDPLQQRLDVLRPGPRRPSLKLHRLSRTRISPNGNRPGVGIRTDEIANEEIAAVKFLGVFVNHEPDKQIALGLLLLLRGKATESLRQYLVRR